MKRKTVTIVFADVVESTSLVARMEPESARRVLDAFFDALRGVVERHGGVVEKFIGDAVVAVFGVPVVHEDDALRAVRAATDMASALRQLNETLETSLGFAIQMRIGINTGDVVAGDGSSGQSFVTGDAVNVAARLETAAGPGEILMGESTFRLVQGHATAERLGPMQVKGLEAPVVVYRLAGVGSSPHRARRSAAFIGRAEELASLEELYDEAARGTTRLVTVIGAAGVGKSRLLEEFTEARIDEATIIRGRCLPYGEGITFWPIKEAISQAAGLEGSDDPATARDKIRFALGPASDADLVADRIAETVGLLEAVADHHAGSWAVRRFLEELARARPLIVVLDDIQWAEPRFLELVDDVVSGSEDSPILVVCMARPEVFETLLSWAASDERRSQLFLESLSSEESGLLLRGLLDGRELDDVVRAKIVEASDGLPLFVEELVAMLVDDGALVPADGRWIAQDVSRITAPATIHALLAARLDRLEEVERALLARGAVEGQVFHRGALAHLTPEEERADLDDHLAALTLKELVRPEIAEFASEDAYRFHHLLLRDVAYESLGKDERSALHERLADWIEQTAGKRVAEYDEILGYHLERAYRYERELRPSVVDEALARRAATRLGDAGVRAHARGDWSAAANLLERALELLPRDAQERERLDPKLAEATIELAPTEPGFLSIVRCVARVPPGHSWRARERGGGLVLRCARCGREKGQRTSTPGVTKPSESQWAAGPNV
jgi:class 3 adenylate cyclase